MDENYPAGRQVDCMEDAYGGTYHASFSNLLAENEAYWHGPYGSLNWPVWIEYDEENEAGWSCGPTVTVGTFMPRHGYCRQDMAPATPEQAQELRIILMSVWAGRADIGFARYSHRSAHATT